jgi:hypothetical protein
MNLLFAKTKISLIAQIFCYFLSDTNWQQFRIALLENIVNPALFFTASPLPQFCGFVWHYADSLGRTCSHKMRPKIWSKHTEFIFIFEGPILRQGRFFS